MGRQSPKNIAVCASQAHKRSIVNTRRPVLRNGRRKKANVSGLHPYRLCLRQGDRTSFLFELRSLSSLSARDDGGGTPKLCFGFRGLFGFG